MSGARRGVSFMDRRTEAQRGAVTGLRPHSKSQQRCVQGPGLCLLDMSVPGSVMFLTEYSQQHL